MTAPGAASKLLGATAALVAAALLAACGGGGGGYTPGAASAAMIQSFNADAAYCDISQRLPDPAASASNTSWTWNSTGAGSATGSDSTLGLGSMTMKTDFTDWRNVDPNRNWVSAGYSNGTTGMGVQNFVLLGMPAGAIACIVPAASLKVTSQTPVLIGTTLTTATTGVVQWQTKYGNPLPVSSLPGYPVDAFELVANYPMNTGPVMFSAPKTSVADQTALQVCHLTRGATNWDCAAPNVADAGDKWSITLASRGSGTYVLVSSHAAPGQ